MATRHSNWTKGTLEVRKQKLKFKKMFFNILSVFFILTRGDIDRSLRLTLQVLITFYMGKGMVYVGKMFTADDVCRVAHYIEELMGNVTVDYVGDYF